MARVVGKEGLEGVEHWRKKCKNQSICPVHVSSIWDQPRCLSAGEYTQWYPATQKEEILSFLAKWIELEDTVLRGKSQMQKDKGFMLALICGSQIR